MVKTINPRSNNESSNPNFEQEIMQLLLEGDQNIANVNKGSFNN